MTSTLCPRHVHHPSIKQYIAYAYSLQPILPLYGRFTTLFTVPHQCSKQCNAMEEISGRADGADETRIDEFTTEVAQEEICDGADCADGFTTVAQEEISGADKTLRVDDFTTVAQEEISGRADGADGSTTEVAQEVSGRPEGADETRMDEFTTVAQFLDHLSNTWLPHFQASNSSGTSSGQDDRPDHLGLCDRQADGPAGPADDGQADGRDGPAEDGQADGRDGRDGQSDSWLGEFQSPDRAGGPDTPSDGSGSVSDLDHACSECIALGRCLHCGQPLPKRRAR